MGDAFRLVATRLIWRNSSAGMMKGTLKAWPLGSVGRILDVGSSSRLGMPSNCCRQ